ncbi:feS cluster assembly protein SufD [bacterium BMS3Bbin04]|nr:feS cluster assembly protein SufD [bacterium BMS3Bbin04]
MSFNAGLAKINWATNLAGRGANSRWSGLLLGDTEQHFDTHTRHQHTSGESFSDLLYKVALRDKSMAAYTGLIAVDEHARNCEAYQENRNLLLSADAHVESIPELEIINDDVKCSHGVTVGPLEEEQLFYLESRGIERDEAMRIILAGYYEAVLERVPEAYQETARNELLNKLMGEHQNGNGVH